MSALNTLVSEAVDLVVHCVRTAQGPRVSEILAVEDLVAGAAATHFTVSPVFTRNGTDAPLTWTGQVPARLDRWFRQAGQDLVAVLPDPPAAHGEPAR